MGLFDWITNGKKPLSQMSRTELRRQELLLQRDRDRLMKRVSDLAKNKQDIFERGKTEKTPEVRRMLAQEFDLKTTEQLLVSRQLNIRSKEALTVTRMRMLRENTDRAKAAGSSLGLVSEKDLVALEKLIANDSITAEIYQDRLDSMLHIEADETGAAMTEGGKQVMDIWEQMDTGLITDAAQGFDEADRRVRERHKSAEGA